MLKKITKWETEDGKVFDTQEEAEDYMFEQEKEVMTHATEQERAMREDFEHWSKSTNQGYDLTRNQSGRMQTYECVKTEHAWRGFFHGWRTGRSTPAAPVPHTKVKADIRWDAENQHHIPTLLIEFEPVPAGEPCDAKGWTDRDNLAAMLATTPSATRGSSSATA